MQQAGGKMEPPPHPTPGVSITIGTIYTLSEWGERKGKISRLTAENGGSNGPGTVTERLSNTAQNRYNRTVPTHTHTLHILLLLYTVYDQNNSSTVKSV